VQEILKVRIAGKFSIERQYLLAQRFRFGSAAEIKRIFAQRALFRGRRVIILIEFVAS